jgi:hypothetical protein
MILLSYWKSEKIFMAYGVQYSTNLLGFLPYHSGDRRGCDHMVVGFTTTCAISAYNH